MYIEEQIQTKKMEVKTMQKTIYIKGNSYGHLYTHSSCTLAKLTFKKKNNQWDLEELSPCYSSIASEKIEQHKQWLSENV